MMALDGGAVASDHRLHFLDVGLAAEGEAVDEHAAPASQLESAEYAKYAKMLRMGAGQGPLAAECARLRLRSRARLQSPWRDGERCAPGQRG